MAQYSITILLFIVAPIVFLAVLGIVKRKKILLGLGAILVVLIVVLAGLILVPLLFTKTDNGTHETKTPEYLISAENVGLNTLGDRVQYWRNTVDMIIESPEVPFSNDRLTFARAFIGYGPETFIVTYQGAHTEGSFTEDMRRYDTHLPLLLDRPHNHYLYLTATTGLLGLTGFLSILFIFFYLSVKYLRRTQAAIYILILIASIAGMVGYMADIVFNPSTISHELVFWLMLSLVIVTGNLPSNGYSGQLKSTIEEITQGSSGDISQSRGARRYLSVACSILLVALAIGITARPFMADVQLQKGLNLRPIHSGRALAAFQKATELQPGEAAYWGYLGQYSYLMAQYINDETLKAGFLELSTTSYQRASELERYIAFRYYTLADVYLYWAAKGAADKWPEVFSLYDKALKLFPRNAVILNKWSLALIVKDELAEAQTKLDESTSVDPYWTETTFLSGLLLVREGQEVDAANKMVVPIQQTPSTLNDFLDFCLYINAYDMVLPLEKAPESYIQTVSDDWVPHAMLGITGFCTARPDRSLEEFNAAMSIISDNYSGELFSVIIELSELSPDFKTKLSQIASEWRPKLSRTVYSDAALAKLDELLKTATIH